jgi:hypothetical protein
MVQGGAPSGGEEGENIGIWNITVPCWRELMVVWWRLTGQVPQTPNMLGPP